ncbi:hypothetical protein [Natronorubrum sediminis]|uniref:hypothetical protein n=1 Tax=Natronorubrum sediminis TaxID=640943 RepID=UPI001587448B|nr:hypothetical protein [Natronorubrum sediminis]
MASISRRWEHEGRRHDTDVIGDGDLVPSSRRARSFVGRLEERHRLETVATR